MIISVLLLMILYADILSQISEGIGSQTGISIEEAADHTGVGLDILSKECSDDTYLLLANFCLDWRLIGRHIGLTDADLAAVDVDNRSEEGRRIGMLKKWMEKFAHKATYRALIEALLTTPEGCLNFV